MLAGFWAGVGVVVELAERDSSVEGKVDNKIGRIATPKSPCCGL